VELIYPELQLQAGDVINYIGYDNQRCGYEVSLLSSGGKYGYVLLDYTLQSPFVSEFVVEQGARGICETILANNGIDTDSADVDIEQKAYIYKSIPMQYIVAYKPGENIALYDCVKGEVSQEYVGLIQSSLGGDSQTDGGVEAYSRAKSPFLKIKTFVQTLLSPFARRNAVNPYVNTFNHWSDIVLTPAQLGPGLVGFTVLYPLTTLSNKETISQSTMTNGIGMYACAVQAMTNIAKQTGILYGNVYTCNGISSSIPIFSTYLYLWDISNTYITNSDNPNPAYWTGSTYISNIGSSLVALANYNGYNNSFSQTTSFACNVIGMANAFTTFKNAVDNGQSSVFSGIIQIYNSPYESGHSVSVVGYLSVMHPSAPGNPLPFLNIADGWNDNGFRFVLVNPSNFLEMYGTVLSLS
jgi:hypothetical protein